jgi:hypothetical protein
MSELPETLAGVSDVDCTGLQALVTGSTSGIGRAAALALGRLGADVVEELSWTGGDATFVQADFADLDAVRALAVAVREETEGLDLLVNNAGGLFRNGGLTDAGVEYTFHVNHLSPYLLTTELLGHLREGARIVTTASDAHKGASLDLDRVRAPIDTPDSTHTATRNSRTSSSPRNSPDDSTQPVARLPPTASTRARFRGVGSVGSSLARSQACSSDSKRSLG